MNRWLSAIPLAVFVALMVFFSFRGQVDTQILLGVGVLALVLGSLAARDKGLYWNAVVSGLGDRTAVLVVAIMSLVGVFAQLMEKGGLAGGMIWLADTVGMSGGFFMLFTYVACTIVGVATGSTVGTLSVMLPVLFPAGVLLGLPSALVVGAIVSGAATGDHYSPVSDTAIISSSTQRYRRREGVAEVSGVVRARLRYVLPAFLVACVAHFVVGLGASGDQAAAGAVIAKFADVSGLIMVLPVLLVIGVSLSGRSVFESLSYGIVATIVLGLVTGKLPLAELFPAKQADGTKTMGALADGVVEVLPIMLMVMLVMAAYGLVREFGLLDLVTGKLAGKARRTARGTEGLILGLCSFLAFLVVGNNSKVTIIGGPISDAVGGMKGLHPYRRANLVDAVANSVSYVVPWHIWPIGVVSMLATLTTTFPFLEGKLPTPAGVAFASFYPMAIWLVMLVAVVTGWGRRWEGPGGEQATRPEQEREEVLSAR
ncbi:hypothetical protein OIE66_26905 [Nonomuraea sp. NBC_01738]|uniref:Na+/H+ antiporter NhaC family protein n=1 Tax=Nonomuraea sp. NBC_01738 TaxID=2976003 RepID=UPI002E0E1EA0|nr:hypothetical protein OIE66_26905 [Nonomuraea sp. NBC_01738]